MTTPAGSARLVVLTELLASAGGVPRPVVWADQLTDRILTALTAAGWLRSEAGLVTAETGPAEDTALLAPGDQDVIATPEEYAILKAVAETFGLPVSVLVGNSLDRKITHARHIAMYLCRTRLQRSYPQLGDLFGRDHSTVHTAVQRITSAISTDHRTGREVGACWRALRRQLTENTDAEPEAGAA